MNRVKSFLQTPKGALISLVVNCIFAGLAIWLSVRAVQTEDYGGGALAVFLFCWIVIGGYRDLVTLLRHKEDEHSQQP